MHPIAVFMWGMVAMGVLMSLSIILGGLRIWARSQKDWAKRRLETANRSTESVYVSENLYPNGLQHRMRTYFQPMGSFIPSVFVDEHPKTFLNAVVCLEYPSTVIRFESKERALPGSRLLVEVARDKLTGEVLEITPARENPTPEPQETSAA